jgi:hypothetical protein
MACPATLPQQHDDRKVQKRKVALFVAYVGAGYTVRCAYCMLGHACGIWTHAVSSDCVFPLPSLLLPAHPNTHICACGSDCSTTVCTLTFIQQGTDRRVCSAIQAARQ